jgi:hypothetical protein
MKIDELYENFCNTKSNLYLDLPIIRELASTCYHVTEFGFGLGRSTAALINARPLRVVSYDILPLFAIAEEYKSLAEEAGVNFRYIRADTSSVTIEPTDLLFIDSLHTAEQITAELRNAPLVKDYIIFHDIVSYGKQGEDGRSGIVEPILDFLRQNQEWKLVQCYHRANGLAVIQKNPTRGPILEPLKLLI